MWNYGVIAVLAVIGGVLFWLQFRHLDHEEDHLNMLPKGQFGGPADEVKPDVPASAAVADPGALSYPKEEMVDTSKA